MPKTISITFPAIQDISIKNWAFSKPEEFEQTVLRTVLGGAIAGLISSIITVLFGTLLFENFVALVFLTSAIATALHTRSWRKSLLAGGFGLGAALVYDLYDDQWPWFAAALSGMVLAPVLASGENLKKMALTGVITGVAIFAGFYATHVMYSKAVLAGLMPGALAQVVYGSVLGLFVGLGSSARHFQRNTDTLSGKFLTAIKEVNTPELRSLLKRTGSLYDLIKSELSEMNSSSHSDIAIQVEALSGRILELCSQCTNIESDLAQAKVDELTQRINELKTKVDKTKDLSAKHILTQAIENLEEQHQALASIETSHDRVLARIHVDVALLERLRFALLKLRSTSLQRSDDQGIELNLSLEALSREIEATCHVVDEVYSQPSETRVKSPIDTIEDLAEDAVSPETMVFRKTA
jgi:hypothetical protein